MRSLASEEPALSALHGGAPPSKWLIIFWRSWGRPIPSPRGCTLLQSSALDGIPCCSWELRPQGIAFWPFKCWNKSKSKTSDPSHTCRTWPASHPLSKDLFVPASCPLSSYKQWSSVLDLSSSYKYSDKDSGPSSSIFHLVSHQRARWGSTPLVLFPNLDAFGFSWILQVFR